MSKIILITGGTRSGKSSYGESLLKDKNDVAYIATSIIYDEEMRERVKRHKESRNKLWSTIEGYKELYNRVCEIKEKYIMLECIGTMITNLIFDKYMNVDNLSKDEINILEKEIVDEILKFLEEIKSKDKNVVIITNEVGFSLVSEYRLGRIFTDILGRVNQILAKESDEVYLVACGLPMRLK